MLMQQVKIPNIRDIGVCWRPRWTRINWKTCIGGKVVYFSNTRHWKPNAQTYASFLRLSLVIATLLRQTGSNRC